MSACQMDDTPMCEASANCFACDRACGRPNDCCPCGVERHAYNGCADCRCPVAWNQHPRRDFDMTDAAEAARQAQGSRPATRKTFWQWWAGQRYGHDATFGNLHEACPPFRTRSLTTGDQLEFIDWTDYSKPMVLHCWDVFACHWPQIFCAAVFGRE